MLSLLDVVEHFPPEQAVDTVTRLMDAFRPGLQLVVIKVPSSAGVIYRTARALQAVGINGPIEQLYQVGTETSHRSYFSVGSLQRFAERCGPKLLRLERDRDFGPASPSTDRIGLTGSRRLPARPSASAWPWSPIGSGCRIRCSASRSLSPAAEWAW